MRNSSTITAEPVLQVIDTVRDTAKISVSAARWAITAAVAVIALLASLHVLSPEFDPSWRVVSEYANGQFGWVLSLLFFAWALSSWTLALSIRSQVSTLAGRIGLVFLIAAGIGEAMASVFDINQPLHDVAGMIGIFGLPIAAMLLSLCLSRTREWSATKKVLLLTANLTWISLVMMLAALIVMMVGYAQAGNKMTSNVVAVVGYPNRLLVVLYCAWVIVVAWQAIKLRGQQPWPAIPRVSTS